MRNKTVAYCSLGCKVNQYDTDSMKLVMEGEGYTTVAFSDIADIYVINTCSVTHVSDRKSRQMISRAHTKNPDAIIVVTGCYAATSPDVVSKLDGVNIVLGTNDRNQIAKVINDYINNKFSDTYINEKDDVEFEDLSADESDKTRAYLKIQDGCNRFCSYCIIPYARGRIRSRSLESTKREFERLAQKGYKEVVLTGIHLMSYGLENKTFDIVDAIAQADNIEGIKRIRLGSLDPDFITDRFVKAVTQNKKVCRHFHLSLQSGSNTVLKRMNRRYTAEQYLEAVNKLRTQMPDCAITTDIIAGFVGETEDEHKQTLDFIKKVGFAKVHVFPYSVRKGTVAELMPNHVNPEIKDRRTHEVAAAAQITCSEYLKSFINKNVDVLVEESVDDENMRGYTDKYVEVILKGNSSLQNAIKTVKVIGIKDNALIGEIIE